MGDPVKIDILLPTFNQSQFLPEALDYLARQTFKDFRLIICDDGSSDDTPKILAGRSPIKHTTIIRHEKNQGVAAALNTAAKECRAELRTWVSSDNRMAPTWLETLVRAMVPGVGAVFSDFTLTKNKTKKGANPEDVRAGTGPWYAGRLMESENCFYGPSFLMRADVWDGAGPHRGLSAHDYDHWARVEEECARRNLEIRHVPEALCYYRQHAGQWVKREPWVYDAGKWREEAKKRRGMA